jgi:hypothetical protein
MIYLVKFAEGGQMLKVRSDLLHEIESNKKRVVRYLHTNCDPYLQSFQEANEALLAIEAARKKLDELERDSKEFDALMGRFQFHSVKDLSNALQRERNRGSNIEYYIRFVKEQELAEHPDLNPEQLEALPEVRKYRLKLEEIQSDAKPRIDNLEKRLFRAREIVRKYSPDLFWI